MSAVPCQMFAGQQAVGNQRGRPPASTLHAAPVHRGQIVGHLALPLVGLGAYYVHRQSTGIDQVNRAVSDMDEMTQQNAALVEEATAASQSMAQ